MLVLKKTWDSQPQVIVPIDRTSSLASELQASFEFGPWGSRDITEKFTPDSTSTLQLKPSTLGVVYSGVRASTTKLVTTQNAGVTGASPFTVSFWVNLDFADTSRDWSFAMGVDGTNTCFVVAMNILSAGDIYLYSNNGDLYTSGSALQASVWNHISITYSGGAISSTISLRVNGILKSLTYTGIPAASLNLTNAPFRFGANFSNSDVLRGGLASISIWKRVLTVSELELVRLNGYSLFEPHRINIPAYIAAATATTNRQYSFVTG